MNPIEEKRKINNFLMQTSKKENVNLPRKQKNLIVNKIHKVIVKEFKLNVNCYIKTSKNHNLPQF
jgi:hypothetical protein